MSTDLAFLRRGQEELVRTLLHGHLDIASLGGLFQGPGPDGAGLVDGLTSYRRNLRAHAQAALAGDYPLLHALVEAPVWTRWVDDYVEARPPGRADWALWTAGWPDWLAGQGARPDAPAPWHSDLARLEAARVQVERAADLVPDPRGLNLPDAADPGALRPRWAPGARLCHVSGAAWRHWHAMSAAVPLATDPVALDGEVVVFFWRSGWRACWQAWAPGGMAAWMAALLAGEPLGRAPVGPELDLHAALAEAVRRGWWLGWQGDGP